jgi:hypothetical protein
LPDFVQVFMRPLTAGMPGKPPLFPEVVVAWVKKGLFSRYP